MLLADFITEGTHVSDGLLVGAELLVIHKTEPAGTGNSLDELIMGELGMMSDEEKQVFYNMILFNRLNRKVV